MPPDMPFLCRGVVRLTPICTIFVTGKVEVVHPGNNVVIVRIHSEGANFGSTHFVVILTDVVLARSPLTAAIITPSLTRGRIPIVGPSTAATTAMV